MSLLILLDDLSFSNRRSRCNFSCRKLDTTGSPWCDSSDDSLDSWDRGRSGIEPRRLLLWLRRWAACACRSVGEGGRFVEELLLLWGVIRVFEVLVLDLEGARG